MNTTSEEGKKPSFAPNDLLSIEQVSKLTGLSRASLHQYSADRNRGRRCLGPKPTRLPGVRSLLYRFADVRRYAEEGWTGEGEK